MTGSIVLFNEVVESLVKENFTEIYRKLIQGYNKVHTVSIWCKENVLISISFDTASKIVKTFNFTKPSSKDSKLQKYSYDDLDRNIFDIPQQLSGIYTGTSPYIFRKEDWEIIYYTFLCHESSEDQNTKMSKLLEVLSTLDSVAAVQFRSVKEYLETELAKQLSIPAPVKTDSLLYDSDDDRFYRFVDERDETGRFLITNEDDSRYRSLQQLQSYEIVDARNILEGILYRSACCFDEANIVKIVQQMGLQDKIPLEDIHEICMPFTNYVENRKPVELCEAIGYSVSWCISGIWTQFFMDSASTYLFMTKRKPDRGNYVSVVYLDHFIVGSISLPDALDHFSAMVVAIFKQFYKEIEDLGLTECFIEIADVWKKMSALSVSMSKERQRELFEKLTKDARKSCIIMGEISEPTEEGDEKGLCEILKNSFY